ncbi:phage terminase large subunit [Helicobacter cynogastricus]|uniref:phage terminase large subunit n=1 Tax=Helicobacter cynogastricus TaxID=329937 RepID=UPI000CF16AE6|nr:phage terminase large subunit [Helicobacter cynogastricus]
MNESLEDLKQYLKSLKSAFNADPKRKSAALKHFGVFAQTYFSHHLEKGDHSHFRESIYNHIKTYLEDSKICIFKAYRGAYKTTLLARMLTIWLFARNERHYMIYIGNKKEDTEETIEWLKIELTENALLRQDFQIQKGYSWRKGELAIDFEGVHKKIKSYSIEENIRGLNFLGKRPDLIICDDMENGQRIQSKKYREDIYKQFESAILKLPARKGDYNILVVGTTLHEECLLLRLEQRWNAKSYSFPLVLDFGPNIDGLSAQNIHNYDLSKVILDDPSLDKKEVLMEFLGNKNAFLAEFQNTPTNAKDAILGDFELYTQLPPQIDAIYMGIDPALGKAKGDFFAIALVHYSKAQRRYFARVHAYKEKPDKMINIVLNTYAHALSLSPYVKIGIEVVAFQAFFKDQLKKRAQELGLHFFRPIELKNTTHKEIRIDSLAPLLSERVLLIDAYSHELISELQSYPKSAHDDCLDALEFAMRIARHKNIIDYVHVRKSLAKRRFKSSGPQNRL